MIEKSAAYWLQCAVNDRITAAMPTIDISEKTQKDTPTPYIELYDVSVVGDLGVKCPPIKLLRMTIRAFDDSENSDTVKDMIDDVISSITGSPLVLDGGFRCYHSAHERSEPSVLQRDRKLWQGEAQFTFRVIQTS